MLSTLLLLAQRLGALAVPMCSRCLLATVSYSPGHSVCTRRGYLVFPQLAFKGEILIWTNLLIPENYLPLTFLRKKLSYTQRNETTQS